MGCGRKSKIDVKKENGLVWSMKGCIDPRAGTGYHRWRWKMQEEYTKKWAKGWWVPVRQHVASQIKISHILGLGFICE